MTLLSRKADYALLILSHLDHKKPDTSCAREVADRYGLGQPFVANILKELCAKGFVTSHRGVKGGYQLACDPEAVSLAQLLEALDESFRLTACSQHLPGDGCALSGACPVQGPIADVHRRIRELLGKVTLAELFRPPLPTVEVGTVLAALPLVAAGRATARG